MINNQNQKPSWEIKWSGWYKPQFIKSHYNLSKKSTFSIGFAYDNKRNTQPVTTFNLYKMTFIWGTESQDVFLNYPIGFQSLGNCLRKLQIFWDTLADSGEMFRQLTMKGNCITVRGAGTQSRPGVSGRNLGNASKLKPWLLPRCEKWTKVGKWIYFVGFPHSLVSKGSASKAGHPWFDS